MDRLQELLPFFHEQFLDSSGDYVLGLIADYIEHFRNSTEAPTTLPQPLRRSQTLQSQLDSDFEKKYADQLFGLSLGELITFVKNVYALYKLEQLQRDCIDTETLAPEYFLDDLFHLAAAASSIHLRSMTQEEGDSFLNLFA